MARPDAELAAAWRRWLPGTPDIVVGRYREPHRHYHGVRHLHAVVTEAQRLLRTVTVADQGTVVAAAFFHDVVYDPRSSTNEADSAKLADAALGDWPEARRAEVTRLVLATGTHLVDGPHDQAAMALLDADLAVLGAEPAVYEAYRRGVRAEYAHVSDETWRAGRAAVLVSFLERPSIFHTAAMAAHEARARANLTAELVSLR